MPKMCARLSCGRDFHCVPDINTALDTACKSGFDFLCLPLVNPRYRREFINGPAKKRPGALTRSDMVVSSQDWSSLIVGKVSPWLQNDSKIDTVRKNSDAALRQELKYAAHLGMPAIMVPLKSRNILNLARCLNEHMLCSYFQQQFWMQVPLVAPWDQRDDVIEGLDGGDSPTEDTWEWWHLFRTLCDCNKRLGICLEMTADLPSESVLERWLSEPIKTVSMSTNLFLTNKKGYPVLSKAHQSFLRRLFRLDVQLILTGVDRHPDKGIRAYQQYLDHLWQNQTPPDAISQFARGYEDYLQSPLQPLMDNLESQTYEIFEKDPIKYSQYQKKFLRFVFQGIHYHWTVLPFGISTALWLFTRITKPITKFLHLHGVVFESYIDDCIQAQIDPVVLLRQLEFSMKLLWQLGWLLNAAKSELTLTQTLQFIGATFDMHQGLIFVPQDRWLKIQRLFPLALSQARTLRQWQELWGLLTSAQALTQRTQLQPCPLQRFLRPYLVSENLKELIRLTKPLRPFLQWWLVEQNVCARVCLMPFIPTHCLFVDASLGGLTSSSDSQAVVVRRIGLAHQRTRVLGGSSRHSTLGDGTSGVLPADSDRQLHGRLIHQPSQVDRFGKPSSVGVSVLPSDRLPRHRCSSQTHSRSQKCHRRCGVLLRSAISHGVAIEPTDLSGTDLPVIKAQVDLFSRQFNHQLLQFVSTIPDQLAWDLDALAISIVMVVGAGRGPLVRAAIAAASQADRKIKKLYAVEKNPNAVVTLENLKDEMWGEQVDVISCDMRFWEAPEQTDILVSELLGSFGDNELSPECLDGAQRFLKDDGISIPCKYTSYLAPIQSAKLYNEVRQCKEKDKGPEAPFEMPYVVRLHNCQLLSEPQKVFTFVHPNKDEVIDNSRYKSLDFTISNDCVLHGFAGYFDCVLFAHVTLSIVPATHSPGMFSWFPILFPIKRPLLLKGESQVVLDIWRLCTDKNVWYEWAVQDPIALSIHNPKGRSYTIGL
ncbi:protein arginine N-methyltransferase 5-like [Haliotis rubra]|uniref:protein arginine N-methyltransferase 5-like n=1 Tax=Haliotis rubra TaxID=36100 RepID=UPI001EE60539|nr:protein arginine N-methyltransferase 5-like [Haliotis rubra]